MVVYVNTELPTTAPDKILNLPAWAGESTCPTVTAVNTPLPVKSTCNVPKVGNVEIVKLAIVPSVSSPVNEGILTVEPVFILFIVISSATGGLFAIGIVNVAGVASVKPSLSLAEYVNTAFPV